MLKREMSSTLVLALPDFEQTFQIEIDAARYGIGVVLQQNRRPIAVISKKLGEDGRNCLCMKKRYWLLFLFGRNGNNI